MPALMDPFPVSSAVFSAIAESNIPLHVSATKSSTNASKSVRKLWIKLQDEIRRTQRGQTEEIIETSKACNSLPNDFHKKRSEHIAVLAPHSVASSSTQRKLIESPPYNEFENMQGKLLGNQTRQANETIRALRLENAKLKRKLDSTLSRLGTSKGKLEHCGTGSNSRYQTQKGYTGEFLCHVSDISNAKAQAQTSKPIYELFLSHSTAMVNEAVKTVQDTFRPVLQEIRSEILYEGGSANTAFTAPASKSLSKSMNSEAELRSAPPSANTISAGSTEKQFINVQEARSSLKVIDLDRSRKKRIPRRKRNLKHHYNENLNHSNLHGRSGLFPHSNN